MSETMTPLAILQGARQLIQDPKSWIQEDLARDASGNRVSVTADTAVCFCMTGAVSRAGRADDDPSLSSGRYRARHLLDEAIRVLFPDASKRAIVPFNDHNDTTHADVLKVFDHAIQFAQSEVENA